MRGIRILLSVVAILLGTTSSAQLKTVAITEVVNKSGDLEYVQRVKIRTHLTAAISKKPGYSAVDRVDIAHILNEQSFQRTGLVDNATIKKLGAITGADYVLMIEAVKTNHNTEIYVVVKLLNVETSDIKMVKDLTISTAAIENGCQELANLIIGGYGSSDSAGTQVNKPVLLYDYLMVFPNDLGMFRTSPTSIIANINSNNTYGRNNWRLPTREELSIIRNSATIIPGYQNIRYMTSDGYITYDTPVAVRLVSEITSEEKREAERNRVERMLQDGLGRNGIYQVGDYYKKENVEGVVFAVSDDGRHGTIVGMKSMQESWFAAQKWCQNCGMGWRLPTKEELYEIVRVKAIVNQRISEKGGHIIESTWCWSSSAITNSAFGVLLKIDRGTIYGGYSDKKECNYVRVVCGF
ncbi:MAG: hypothetical protein IJE21_07935 [Alistipes sp.]|nr:hypothetical protein [Alistipes sp.]